MSELVERVSRVILGFEHLPDEEWSKYWAVFTRTGVTPPKARAAIREVAVWLREKSHCPYACTVGDLMKQLEETK